MDKISPLFFLTIDNFFRLISFSRLLEEVVTKYFCMQRDDAKTEMAAISEEGMKSQYGETPVSIRDFAEIDKGMKS